MKRFLVFTLLCTLCITGMAADLKLVSGSMECLRNEKYITAELDCSETKWNDIKSFDAYLAKAKRMRGWEKKSMEYFYEWFNDEISSVSASNDTNDVNYKVVVKIKNVDNGGKIIADIILVNMKTNENMAIFYFKGSDGDSKDYITFRDPMKQVGECVGKALYKYLKTGKVSLMK